MTEVAIKRVYEEYSPADGYRVLVDKLWPRGVKKENLHYDLWAKYLAPSTGLREWFHEDKEKNWEGFSLAYRKELEKSALVKEFIAQIKSYPKITLLYAAKDKQHSHALVLQEFIQQYLN